MLFGAYAFLEICAVHARIAASLTGLNAIGASIEKMTHTVKRIAVFSYPPIIGVFHVLNEPEYIFYSAYFSLVLSIIVIVLSFLFRINAIKTFFVLIRMVSQNNSKSAENGRPILYALTHNNVYFRLSRSSKLLLKRLDTKILWFSATIYSVYGGSIFFINIFVLFFSGYEAIVFQALGLINGVGTLTMAFILDPIISRKLETGRRMNTLSNSVLMGILVAFGFFLPVCFIGLHLLYLIAAN